MKSEIDAKKTTITYNSKEDRSKFNIIVFVLTKVHELLSKKLTVTRRYTEFDAIKFGNINFDPKFNDTSACKLYLSENFSTKT